MSHHHDLIDTTEMYLKVVFELEEEGVVPLRARIAERLHQSGPTVSQTVARMERDGLLTVQGDRHLEFTAEGRAYATRVMRKHRLVERLLVDVIKLEWDLAHTEACRWEHVVSEDVERRLVDILDHPSSDPYGNPIPGLTELDRSAEEAAPMVASDAGLESLDKVLADSGGAETRAVVRRIGEPLQTTPELLATLRSGGVTPGGRITVDSVRGKGETVRLSAAADEVAVLPAQEAAHIFVERA